MGDARPRVLVVGQLPPPTNGMTRMTETLLRSRLRDRFDVEHVDTSDHREAAAIGRLDVRNVWLAFVHACAFCLALRRRPDLCYVPIARTRLAFLRDLGFLLPARLMRRTVVVHLHSRDFIAFYDAEPRWMRLVIRLALGGDVHAIVLGESRRADFGALIPDARVHVVPNGIEDVGEGPPAETRGRVVLHVSSLRREKGVFTVLAVAHALKDTTDAQFVVAGDWRRSEERDEAERFVLENGLRERVRFVGTVTGEEKAALLQQAAVMLFPSAYPFEGHPVVVIEALSAGTPVVASALAAIPEMIDDGESGFLVEDPASAARRVAQLLADEGLRGGIGRAGRARYEALFTADRFAERLGHVWDCALFDQSAASGGTTSLRRTHA